MNHKSSHQEKDVLNISVLEVLETSCLDMCIEIVIQQETKKDRCRSLLPQTQTVYASAAMSVEEYSSLPNHPKMLNSSNSSKRVKPGQSFPNPPFQPVVDPPERPRPHPHCAALPPT